MIHDLPPAIVHTRASLVGQSAAMRAVYAWTERISTANVPVLLLGETGTGKDCLARVIHQASGRRGSFLPVNCGAIPDSMIEAELFGYVKGAFTGAAGDKLGLVEAAASGTLFLDEIGELPLGLQVRLLCFLDSGEYRRIGETRARRVDARIIAATNRNLPEAIERGQFRADLFYRLSVATCVLPPLRERGNDLELLIDSYLPVMAATVSSPRPLSVTRDALERLYAYRWPGNVRELINVLTRAALTAAHGEIGGQHIDDALRLHLASESSACLPDEPARERQQILAALEKNRWRLNRTAALLGISRSTLWRRMLKYNIRVLIV